MQKSPTIKYGIFSGNIVTVYEDGSIPLNARIAACLLRDGPTLETAELLHRANSAQQLWKALQSAQRRLDCVGYGGLNGDGTPNDSPDEGDALAGMIEKALGAYKKGPSK